ncbi:MAG: aminoglycoside phosphotransferase, partial [Proteobacteria bacterium]|nr:aminoglycoside phosphotransferase [Pseudomonadota bacterium]
MTDPAAIARQFVFPGAVLTVDEYGSGNVNDTYLVRVAGGQGTLEFILQRLNPQVFPDPERIMHNLRVLDNHVRPKLLADPGRRWELPSIIPSLNGADYFRDQDGAFWRV